jgi:hypothetical protein
MICLQNILIILIIIFLLNNIKISNMYNDSTPSNFTNEDFNNLNLFDKDTMAFKKHIPIYGDDQFEMKEQVEKVNFKYQNFDILEKDKELELTNNLNNAIPFVYKEPPVSDKYIKTNLPSQQDYIYDFKHFEPSNKDQNFDFQKIDYKDRDIKEIYQSLITNYKVTGDAKPILNTKIEGAFGESFYDQNTWSYDNDKHDDMAYDTTLSNLLAL